MFLKSLGRHWIHITKKFSDAFLSLQVKAKGREPDDRPELNSFHCTVELRLEARWPCLIATIH